MESAIAITTFSCPWSLARKAESDSLDMKPSSINILADSLPLKTAKLAPKIPLRLIPVKSI